MNAKTIKRGDPLIRYVLLNYFLINILGPFLLVFRLNDFMPELSTYETLAGIPPIILSGMLFSAPLIAIFFLVLILLSLFDINHIAIRLIMIGLSYVLIFGYAYIIIGDVLFNSLLGQICWYYWIVSIFTFSFISLTKGFKFLGLIDESETV